MSNEWSGTVKWFNDKKGFGFIGQDDGPMYLFIIIGIVSNGFRAWMKVSCYV
jgi:cold shock CspA family protein